MNFITNKLVQYITPKILTNKIEEKYNVMRFHMKKIIYHSNPFYKNVLQNNRILFIIGRLLKIKNIELTALKSEQCTMCPIKSVKHYFFSFASIADGWRSRPTLIQRELSSAGAGDLKYQRHYRERQRFQKLAALAQALFMR